MRRIVVALAGLALVAAGAGCGGAASAGSAAGSKKSVEDQHLEFVKCMRSHGVEIDANVDGDKVAIAIAGPGGKGAGPDAETEKAMKACEDKMPKLGEDLSPEERAKMEDAMLAFAKCMRSHGIDMPDPENGGFLKIAPGKGGPDMIDEEFRAAEEACNDKLPNRGKITREGS